MKKLLLSFAVTCAAFTAIATASHADTNPAMAKSMYCRNMAVDPICMGPKMMAMRAEMMAMTKAKVMEARNNYCRSHTVAQDPICNPKMMHDTVGF